VEGRPETRFTRSGELSIAYQVVGEGPVDLVFVPGYMSHVELNWDYVFYRSILEEVAEYARLIVLDKRGTGLSDRSLGLGTLEERMDDLRAVMDHVGCDRAVVLGVSEGAAMCALFAATCPDRVEALIILAGVCPGVPVDLPLGSAERLLEWIGERWTTGQVLENFIQHPPDPGVARQQLARFERYTCTPTVAQEIMRRNLEGDIRAFLPTITVPTLVIHQEGDPICPAAHGRYYGEHIPGAEVHMVAATSTGAGGRRTTTSSSG
jgi:pimeloyl-ACP methyl ester carboxylesterase